ncbi:MAG TPA: SRPBCC family protein [Allosphingosinicella sp.]|nr:SRPBCC family protein [Allosphingosinicella sp.]
MSELELSVTRFIDAPPETVYRAYTERTADWWVPKPWTTPAVEWDLRTGGRMYTEMRGPDGNTDGGEGLFLEVVPGQRIVWTNAFKPGWEPQTASNEGCDMAIVAIITLEPEGSGTRYTARVRHWDEEAVKKHREMGFEQGWSICADQLAAIAEAEAGRTKAA